MSYFGPGGKPLTCQAVIDVSTAEGRVRRCVLTHGHYLEDGPGGTSWHTDCPDAAGRDDPPADHYEHNHETSCAVWSDRADGAHYADRPAQPAEEKQPGRAVTDLGDYDAQVMIGGATLHVRGSARLVSRVIGSFADAFEAER